MATDGKTVEKWETVGKFKAKTRAQKQALSKTMLKADQLPLSTIQSPIFEGVNGKLPTNVPGKKLKSENNPVHKPPSNKQNIRKKLKKSANDNKFTFQSIEEAVKNEEIFTKIEEDLTGLKETFPNNEITWLKEIAAKLNTRLSCPETEITEQDFDFPINKANKNSHVILLKTFGKNVSKEVVRLIFQQYLTTMLDYMGRDMPSWGYRICLQAITHSHPTICSENLEKHLEKMKTYANDMKRCRALLWAIGQVGLKDMRCGLKVWLHLHLPNLDMKKLAPYSMSYIERIMNKCQRNPEQFLSDCLLPKHFVKITELVNGNFPMKDRMQKIYPTFRHLITHNSMAKREFFTHLMKFSSADEEVTNQLVKIGVTCLQEDPHCFAIWREPLL
uniref:Uncharacterized protein n=1 Tax=Ciona savignyi TaxID=51511 RepID=H2ZEX5_CIOSA